jgi:hypothetical protein
VPSKAPWRAFFKAYVLDPSGAARAPGEGGDATPPAAAPETTDAADTAQAAL